MVRWDEKRAAFAVATSDHILWDREAHSFIIAAPAMPSQLVILGPAPVPAVAAARRIYWQATANERAAQRAREHKRAIDVLSLLVPFFGTIANIATRIP